MPTNIQVVHASDFIKASPEGRLDLQETTRLLMEVASLIPPGHVFHILLDTRHACSTMTPTDLWHLASALGNRGMTFRRKTAVLCPLERFEAAQFFELCSKNQGLPVAVFTSFEEAINWLCGIDGGPQAPIE